MQHDLNFVLSAAIIGRLGTGPLGAVGLSTLLFMFSNLFFNFLTVVTTSAVANAAAEDDTEEVNPDVLLPLNVSSGHLDAGAVAFARED